MPDDRVIFMQDRDGFLRRWTPDPPAQDEAVKRLRAAASMVDQQLEDGGVTADAHKNLALALAALDAESR